MALRYHLLTFCADEDVSTWEGTDSMDRLEDAFTTISAKMDALPPTLFRAPANFGEPIASLIAKVEARRDRYVRPCASASR